MTLMLTFKLDYFCDVNYLNVNAITININNNIYIYNNIYLFISGIKFKRINYEYLQ